MKYLLDTQIFLWTLDDVKKLKSPIRQAIEDTKNSIYISVVNVWEMSIKQKIGKMSLKRKLNAYVDDSGFEILNINLNHVYTLDTLPLYHRDPFDRLLIAQAKSEKLTLITSDPVIKKYDVKTFTQKI